jgi:hypothetical protein
VDDDPLLALLIVCLVYNYRADVSGSFFEAPSCLVNLLVNELQVQVMETRKTALGEEHPSTLTSMNNLAFTLKGQDRTDEAILLLETFLALATQVFGRKHPNVLSSSATLRKWTQDYRLPDSQI